MARVKTAPPRGVIRPGRDADAFLGGHHLRFEVDPPLDAHLEHFWSVGWKVKPGHSVARASLGHPVVHVVWEGPRVSVVGVHTGRYTRVLEGEGRTFAAKFRPGAFRGLWKQPMHTLTDREVPLAEVVGARKARAYRDAMADAPDDDARVAWATSFWLEVLPVPAGDAELLAALVHAATVDRSLTTVEQLRARAGLHLRELQRWFRDAVGISPKWMIQRYRLHDALLEVERGARRLTDLAAELGYADQAHFTRDFRALVGVPPSRYAPPRQ